MKLMVSLAGLACLLVACQEKPAEPTASSAPVLTNTTPISGSTNVTFHLVRGVVKRIDAEGKRVSIQHEEIPEYMPAMTMPFKVKDAKELEGVQAGDTIFFRLWVSEDESWIDKLTKVGPAASGPTNAAPARESVRVVRDVEPLSVGIPCPTIASRTSLGRRCN